MCVCVCESITGIVCNKEVYTVYGNNKVDVVMYRLLQPFEQNSHRVFMDKHYSSPTCSDGDVKWLIQPMPRVPIMITKR